MTVPVWKAPCSRLVVEFHFQILGRCAAWLCVYYETLFLVLRKGLVVQYVRENLELEFTASLILKMEYVMLENRLNFEYLSILSQP